MKTFTTLAKYVFILFLGVAFLSIATPAFAQGPQEWTGVCVGGGIDGAETVPTIQGVQCLIGNLLSVAISGIGLAGFLMMIYGSFRYMLSRGNSQGVEAGRNTITMAVVGFVVALSAFFIVQLVAQFTGVDVILNFSIPTEEISRQTRDGLITN